VSAADLKAIAKTIKGDQALACHLYKTGIVDAMDLAGLAADGSKMSKRELQIWCRRRADDFRIHGSLVTDESPHARNLAMEGVRSQKEHIASSGWCTHSGLAATKADKVPGLAEIAKIAWDRGEGNPRRTQFGRVHPEWLCDRGWNLGEASAGAGEGGGTGDWHYFRGYGRHGL